MKTSHGSILFSLGGGGVGYIADSEVVGMGTLEESDEIERFFTGYCDPFTGTLSLRKTLNLTKDAKGGFKENLKLE